MRFPCCGKVYPCDECHDDVADHMCDWAKTIICGFCSVEQKSSNEACSSCKKSFVTKSSAQYWEGGQGTRNKTSMSKNDQHKYKG